MKTNKAQGLPVNIVVTVIIGLVLFGLGMGLFTEIFSSGDEQIGDWNKEIVNGITSLECDGGDWICSPAYELDNGEGGTFTLYIANKGDTNQKFNINFLDIDGAEGEIERNNCGSIVLNYLTDIDLSILSGESAKIPFYVKATQVTKVPCSFPTIVTLLDEDGNELDRTSVIIKVQ